MIILVWYGMAWHGMVWHGMARGAGTLGPYGTLGPRLVPYHAIPCHTIPCHAIPYHTSIIIFLYSCIFILLFIIILLYYYISDIVYCSLFVVHAPIQHLGHLKDLILCIIFNIFLFCISRFLNFWCWSQPHLSYPIRNIWASNSKLHISYYIAPPYEAYPPTRARRWPLGRPRGDWSSPTMQQN